MKKLSCILTMLLCIEDVRYGDTLESGLLVVPPELYWLKGKEEVALKFPDSLDSSNGCSNTSTSWSTACVGGNTLVELACIFPCAF